MRIAQIAPLMESVPPALYGGTERVVHYLTEELVREGHDVTLFASGDSKTSATLVPCCPRALRLDAQVRDAVAYHILMLERVRQRAASFDIIHFHIDYLQFPIFRDTPHCFLTSLHGRQDLSELALIYREFADVPLVTISNNQRKPLPAAANVVGTVHHGIPQDLFSLQTKPESYIAFLGRISPEKRPDRAIAIATQAGVPLRIAAKVDAADQTYFDEHIAHRIQSPGVAYIGEIGEQQKQEFLGRARALLFPIDWPEPFGLVMIEAMACGTPVIAWDRGSVTEIIEDGLTGFIVSSVEEAVAALKRVDGLDRLAIRRRFEERFTAERMMKDYLRVYERLIGRARAQNASRRAA